MVESFFTLTHTDVFPLKEGPFKVQGLIGKHGEPQILVSISKYDLRYEAHDGYWFLTWATDDKVVYWKEPKTVRDIDILLNELGFDPEKAQWRTDYPTPVAATINSNESPAVESVAEVPVPSSPATTQPTNQEPLVRLSRKTSNLPSGIVYFLSGGDLIKIGFTANTANVRAASVQTMSPVPLKILGTLLGDLNLERVLHAKFSHLRSHGEWFRAEQELVDFIAKESTIWNGAA